MMLISIIIIWTGVLLLVFVPRLHWQDEGVYYSTAIRIVEGDHPYQDFFCCHPPGTAWLNAAGIMLGCDLYHLRIGYWLLGAIYLILIWKICKRFIELSENHSRTTELALLSVCLLATYPAFVDQSTQMLTHLPAIVLAILGFLCLLRPGIISPCCAGIFLGLATLFRIQVLYYLPVYVLFLIVSRGISKGIKDSTSLMMTFGITVLAIHGALHLIYPTYLDCAIRFHLLRPVLSLSERSLILSNSLKDPQVSLGLCASVLLLFSDRRVERAIAIFSISCFIFTLYATRFLTESYLLHVTPFLFICFSLWLRRVSDQLTEPRIILSITCLILATQLLRVGPYYAYQITAQTRWEQDLIQRLRETPGEYVLGSHLKVVHLAGKKTIPDYHNPDCCVRLKSNEFIEWFMRTVARADIIIVNEELLRHLQPRMCRTLIDSHKELVFATTSDEQEFHQRLQMPTISDEK